MADCSDTVPTLAAVAAFADSPTRITGVGFIRPRRPTASARSWPSCGGAGSTRRRRPTAARSARDPAALHGARVRTYDDHRMAMALALLGLRVPGIEIEDPTWWPSRFPAYWAAARRGLAHPG